MIQTLKKTTPRFTLEMHIMHMGKDLCISLFGGDRPHIGAVALAVPHPGLQDEKKTDSSVSILAVTGHKEDELARNIALTLSKACGCTVSVSCGIHLAGASQQEISDVLDASAQLLEKVLENLA